jgi:hypothetical protein
VTYPTEMRRYKIVACILLILSVFGFVLAAPVAVQEVREARVDAVGGGENVIIGSRKRGDSEDDAEPLLKSWAKTQQQASSYLSSAPWKGSSSSAPNYASGTRLNPSFSSGKSKLPLLSASGGTELSWNPKGEANLIQPGTSTGIRPASSSEAKKVSWAPLPLKPKPKNIFSKLFGILKFKPWRRISETAGGAVTEG